MFISQVTEVIDPNQIFQIFSKHLILSHVADATPAPSEYLPNIDSSKYVGPQYSLAGPYRQDKGMVDLFNIKRI